MPVPGLIRFFYPSLEIQLEVENVFLAPKGAGLVSTFLCLFGAGQYDRHPFFPSLAIGPKHTKNTGYTGPAPSSFLYNQVKILILFW